jgi:hypothetical protein
MSGTSGIDVAAARLFGVVAGSVSGGLHPRLRYIAAARLKKKTREQRAVAELSLTMYGYSYPLSIVFVSGAACQIR